jgi:CBS-domain-containing membrane protein
MEDINKSIARAIGSKPAKTPPLPTARDCMTERLITFHPDQPIREVVKVLLSKNITGGPVLNGDNKLVGMISELDCMRALAGTAYEGHYTARDRLVVDEMSTTCLTVKPDDDVFAMAHLFEKHRVRRLPVLDQGVLIGQVSRRDVLRAIQNGW